MNTQGRISFLLPVSNLRIQSGSAIKQILSESLIDLVNKKSLNKITVQMIVDNCNMTRQTFYYHFKDKYDLANWIFRTNVDNITESSSPTLPWSIVLG